MSISFFQSPLWALIKQMDCIAILILLGLLVLSIISIGIIIFKYRLITKQKKALSFLLQSVGQAKNLDAMIILSREFYGSAGGSLLINAINELKNLFAKYQHNATTSMNMHSIIFTNDDIASLESSLNQSISTLMLEEESYLSFLSSSAAVAPLIGLFGTIWGLIHAFIDISQAKSADISTVAPGMAEALIVTLAGLVVAIPALLAFHYFANDLKKIENSLMIIGERFMCIVQQSSSK